MSTVFIVPPRPAGPVALPSPERSRTESGTWIAIERLAEELNRKEAEKRTGTYDAILAADPETLKKVSSDTIRAIPMPKGDK